MGADADLASVVLRDTPSEVPSDVLEVIKRQDEAIQSLVDWCQKLSVESASQRDKLSMQEQDGKQAAAVHAQIRKELEGLKSGSIGSKGGVAQQVRDAHDMVEEATTSVEVSRKICDNCCGRGHIAKDCPSPPTCKCCGSTEHKKLTAPRSQRPATIVAKEGT